MPDPTPEQRVRGRWPGACSEYKPGIGWLVFSGATGNLSDFIGKGETRLAAWADAAGRLDP